MTRSSPDTAFGPKLRAALLLALSGLFLVGASGCEDDSPLEDAGEEMEDAGEELGN
ncbi:MAG: hypothetical protein ACODAC_02665 [Pseudomonadota bacterium]